MQHETTQNPVAKGLAGLNGYQWFVFAMAAMAWMFDCLDQQLFLIARQGAMKDLLPEGWDQKLYGGYATSIFVAGATAPAFRSYRPLAPLAPEVELPAMEAGLNRCHGR